MRFLKQIFTWWSGQTLGTRLMTWRKGVRVGDDEFGNIYYENKDKSKRWVIFPNYSEASTVPAEWHGWLHHSFDNRPGDNPLVRKSWELPHAENKTGSAEAYAPTGSVYGEGDAHGDYQAWAPKS